MMRYEILVMAAIFGSIVLAWLTQILSESGILSEEILSEEERRWWRSFAF